MIDPFRRKKERKSRRYASANGESLALVLIRWQS